MIVSEGMYYRKLTRADHEEYRRVRLDCLIQYPDHFGTTYDEELGLKKLKLSRAIQCPDPLNFVLGAYNADQTLVGTCGFISDMRLKTRHRVKWRNYSWIKNTEHRELEKTYFNYPLIQLSATAKPNKSFLVLFIPMMPQLTCTGDFVSRNTE